MWNSSTIAAVVAVNQFRVKRVHTTSHIVVRYTQYSMMHYHSYIRKIYFSCMCKAFIDIYRESSLLVTSLGRPSGAKNFFWFPKLFILLWGKNWGEKKSNHGKVYDFKGAYLLQSGHKESYGSPGFHIPGWFQYSKIRMDTNANMFVKPRVIWKPVQ